MSCTRKVLILSYYFPPMGMGGTQRIAKFCKYLPDFGWAPIVITVKTTVYYAHDTTLLNDVKHVEIFRTQSLDPLRILTLRKKNCPIETIKETNHSRISWRGNKLLRRLNRLLNWLLIPDTKVLWLPFAIFQAMKIIRHQKIEVIFTTSPPHSIHLAGVFLKLFTGIHWICDFRDEWTGGASQPCPTAWHLWLNRLMEKFALKRADAIIGICKRLVANLQRKSANNRAIYKTIMNGFDADDFKSVQGEPLSTKFTILHCGSMSKVSDPEPFLIALESLFQDHTYLKDKIAVKFIGIDIFGRLNNLIKKYNLSSLVEVTPYMPHYQAIRSMMQAHVLLLIVHKMTKEEIITSKVFEYFATGHRILAVIPPGELADLLNAANAGRIIFHHHINQIKQAILSFYNEYINGTINTKPTQFINQFERKNLTEQLTAIFDTVSKNRRDY